MAEENLQFQAEVSRLLEIVAHSLYSDREVFLRELISNASDACDKRRYLAVAEAGTVPDASQHRITVTPDETAGTLTIGDTGIGMNHQDLVENLGTIARSGTARFMAQTSGDNRADTALIGQFGVGFYSSFMVADRVDMVTRKAGEEQGWRWSSDGKGSYQIAPAERAEPGSDVILHLREADRGFSKADEVRQIVRRYSDHIALPIVLIADGKEETLNSNSALWTRAKSDITPEQATEFYRHLAHAADEPWATVHVRAEGALEYSALLFVPGTKPFDLFQPERRHGVKLYVRRVFITDEAKELVPGYLRFLRGVVDSSDLPLNVSRELLQQSPMLAKIRSNLVRRVLVEIEKKAGGEDYAIFWDNFGAVLKEGLYEDLEHRETLLRLSRFQTTESDQPISLETYVSRMKPGQDAIYTVSGDQLATLKASPQLEGFRAKGVEVLLLTDPIDDFWQPMAGDYQGKPFRSITRGSADLSTIEGGSEASVETASDGEIANLIALFKLSLGDEVKDVRVSKRLTDSPVCLIADEGDLDMRLERLLRQHRQVEGPSRRVLEINSGHKLIRCLASQVGRMGAADRVGDAARLLLDQARIIEGEPLPDAAAFARRLDAMMELGLTGPMKPEPDLAA